MDTIGNIFLWCSDIYINSIAVFSFSYGVENEEQFLFLSFDRTFEKYVETIPFERKAKIQETIAATTITNITGEPLMIK